MKPVYCVEIALGEAECLLRHRKGQLASEGKGMLSRVVKVNLSWVFGEIRFTLRNLFSADCESIIGSLTSTEDCG